MLTAVMIGIDDFSVPPPKMPPMKYCIYFILIKVYELVLHLQHANHRSLTIALCVLRRHPKKIDVRLHGYEINLN